MPDAEVEAMGTVADALKHLSEDERDRVLRWAADRYGVSVGGARGVRVEDDDDDDDAGEDDGAEGDRTNRSSGFDDFAEFYDAVSPQTDPERVLVSCYWVQVSQGKESFGSQELNALLKDLGHAVTSINKAMTANINKKPALVLQMARGGSTQQARKKYKLSAAGKKWVAERLGP